MRSPGMCSCQLVFAEVFIAAVVYCCLFKADVTVVQEAFTEPALLPFSAEDFLNKKKVRRFVSFTGNTLRF